jgi:hypothetical protein
VRARFGGDLALEFFGAAVCLGGLALGAGCAGGGGAVGCRLLGALARELVDGLECGLVRGARLLGGAARVGGGGCGLGVAAGRVLRRGACLGGGCRKRLSQAAVLGVMVLLAVGGGAFEGQNALARLFVGGGAGQGGAVG